MSPDHIAEGKRKDKKAKDGNIATRVLKDKTMGNIKDEELDWIWIGDAEDARDAPNLRKHNVRYILNCTPLRADGGVSNFHEKDSNFCYCRIAMGDNATEHLSSRFEESWQFLERARVREDGGVLVHCQQGVSRSVSMVLSYLMKYYGKTFGEALALAKTARKQACPNDGFTQQLKVLEETLRTTNGYEKVPPKRTRALSGPIGPASRGAVASVGSSASGPARGPLGPSVGPAAGPSIGPGRGPTVGPSRGPPPAGPSRGPLVGPSVGPGNGVQASSAKGSALPTTEKRKAGPTVGPAKPVSGPVVDPSKTKKVRRGSSIDLTS